MRQILLGYMILLLGTGTGRAQQTVFRNGETVCFVGNSITFNGEFFHQIALFHTLRYPMQPIRIFNSGIGGNTAADVLERLDDDVLDKKPQVCVLKLGMNDVKKELYLPEAAKDPDIDRKRRAALETYRQNYEKIIQRLLAAHCRLVLQTPTIYDQTAAIAAAKQTGRNDALGICTQIVKGLAHKYHLPVVDYWNFLGPLNQALQAKDSTATLIGPDRVHPGATGHFLMAYQFLITTGEKPLVAEINITNGKDVQSRQVTLRRIIKMPGGLEFDCLETSLPFPIAAQFRQATELVPFESQLNQELLNVKGLATGHYELLIDQQSCGIYASETLSKGVNLAGNKNTPQYRQAEKVSAIYQQRWQSESDLRFLRAIEFSNLKSVRKQGLDAARHYFDETLKNIKDSLSASWKEFNNYKTKYLLLKPQEQQRKLQMDSLDRVIFSVSLPVVHHFELKKVANEK